MAGQLVERADEVAALKASVEREQQTAEGVRLELAKAQIRAEGAGARVTEAQQREQQLRTELDSVRTELAAARTAKAEAISRADVAEARFDSEKQARAHAETGSSRQAAQSELRVQKLLKAVAGIEGISARATAAEASSAELRKKVAMLEGLLQQASMSTDDTTAKGSKVK